MTTDLDSIKKSLVAISRGDTLLDTLLEFERTLDNAEVFAYRNWLAGEIVEGPTVGKYWYHIVLMYPLKMMPDPDGGLRLTKLGAKVSFKKGNFKRPTKVKGPEDWVDPSTKRAKMIDSEVWLVTIDMPLKYINRGMEQTDDIIQKDIERTEAALSDAYSQGDSDENVVPEDMAQSEMGQDDDMSPEENA